MAIAFVRSCRPLAAEHQVVGHGVIQDQSGAAPVFRNVAHAKVSNHPGSKRPDLAIDKQDPASRCAPRSREHLDQFALAVALHTRDPQDLALVQVKTYTA